MHFVETAAIMQTVQPFKNNHSDSTEFLSGVSFLLFANNQSSIRTKSLTRITET